MTGIEMIVKERQEQIEKHGYTTEVDKNNYRNDIPLIIAAMYCIDPQHMNAPFGWDRDGKLAQKLRQKPRAERLAIAGAFIAAAIDRLKQE